MKKLGAVMALMAGLMLVPALIDADLSLAESSTRPPTQLKQVGDHWTAWDPPPADPNDHVIVTGDTLWDLAGSWFGDPFLWPQIWDENRYILDSHWIYPGDPLVVPGRPTVVPNQGDLPVADARPEPVAPRVIETRPVLVPAADPAELYCSGYIHPAPEPSALRIAGGEIERKGFGQGDIVYLNQGDRQGLRAGDEYAIERATDPVSRPGSKEILGTYVKRLGKVRVLIAHSDTSTAILDFSCEDVREGDELVGWKEIPVPMLSALPEFDRLDVSPSGGPVGQIVSIRDNLNAVGTGNVIHVDLGQGAGITPGDMLTLFRDNARVELPRIMIGQAVVLTVDGPTSTAKIMTSVRESVLGDQVEAHR